METTPSSEQIINNSPTPSGEMIKCGNCDYVGPGLKSGSFFTRKYKCPKCNSEFIGLKNEDGTYENQSGNNRMAILITVIVVIFVEIVIIGILSSVVLASLSTAKEKAKEAAEKANSSLTATTTSTTTVMTKNTKSGFDTSKNLSQDEVQAIVDYVKLQTTFPKEFDKNTTWLDVLAEPNLVIKYEYSIHDLDTTGFSNSLLKNFILKDACTNPDVADELLNKGVVLRYSYTVNDSTKTFDFSISKNDCK